MNLYLVRHGDAEIKKTNQFDSERNLTEEGKKEMFLAANNWKSFVADPALLISSPYVRAFQTAEIVKQVFNLNENIITDIRLAPGSRTNNIVDLVNEFDVLNIFLFGHEPDFSDHVSNLVSDCGMRVNFKKGSLAMISFNRKARISAGTLELFITPNVYTNLK